jgi:hypothetical protein
VNSVLAEVPVDADLLQRMRALAAKDASELAALSKAFPSATRQACWLWCSCTAMKRCWRLKQSVPALASCA